MRLSIDDRFYYPRRTRFITVTHVQVTQLEAKGIRACALNSRTKKTDRVRFNVLLLRYYIAPSQSYYHMITLLLCKVIIT